MAVNVLLDTWMNGEQLIDEVPGRVKDVVGNASLWLVKNVKKGKAYNAVFSGSVKSGEVRPDHSRTTRLCMAWFWFFRTFHSFFPRM